MYPSILLLLLTLANLHPTLATTAIFYSAYLCAGSTIACTSLAADTCCFNASPVYAFSSSITSLGLYDVATVYTGPGGILSSCGIAGCVGGDGETFCCSAGSEGSGISGGSWHEFPRRKGKRGDVGACKAFARPDLVTTVDGEGEWQLAQGDVSEDDFAAIVDKFVALDEQERTVFLIAQGAVYANRTQLGVEVVQLQALS